MIENILDKAFQKAFIEVLRQAFILIVEQSTLLDEENKKKIIKRINANGFCFSVNIKKAYETCMMNPDIKKEKNEFIQNKKLEDAIVSCMEEKIETYLRCDLDTVYIYEGLHDSFIGNFKKIFKDKFE